MALKHSAPPNLSSLLRPWQFDTYVGGCRRLNRDNSLGFYYQETIAQNSLYLGQIFISISLIYDMDASYIADCHSYDLILHATKYQL